MWLCVQRVLGGDRGCVTDMGRPGPSRILSGTRRRSALSSDNYPVGETDSPGAALLAFV